MFANVSKFFVINCIISFDSYLQQRNYKKKIIINFVTSLLLNKRYKVVYNSIFIIINRCTKIIKYIFIITRIDVAKLTKMFFNKIVLRFETLTSIISNKKFVFISVF